MFITLSPVDKRAAGRSTIQVNMNLVRRMYESNEVTGWTMLEFDENDKLEVRETLNQIRVLRF